MSPRAACRLDALGFDQVYDYIAGIADWKAAGLPTEGASSGMQRVADATRTDIPPCTPDETIGAVKARTNAAGWDECVVVDCNQVVVGRLRNQAWEAADSATAEQVMEPGPTTVRLDQLLEPLVGRMATRSTHLVLVTTPQGQLNGAVIRREAEQLLAGTPPEQAWQICDGCPGRWAVRI